MNKTTTITWVLLIILTVISAMFSKLEGKLIVLIILLLAIFKFLGIVFQFMEMKKAHMFWKAIIVMFLLVFTTIIVFVK